VNIHYYTHKNKFVNTFFAIIFIFFLLTKTKGIPPKDALISYNPKLTLSASLTCRMVSSSRCPILSLSRFLSRVRICSSKIMEFFARPQPFSLPIFILLPVTSICVGSLAFPVCDVIAAAITVGLCRLPTSFCTIRTGLIPPCSEPTTGERSA